ncbi:hypothetical protein BCR42DRAFT_457194 [Absidia repens]|uniref:Uncharacterized protein n=1 Tax=Absidia repens TaxID=90262 RepID=A0A1X2HXE8_9FUNG|nr:hypothetical protein BCR42DRAFT_457194 [Absidia repens]
MKTVTFKLLNKKFDDQYTFDLQGYLTFQQFCASMKILNRSIKKASLPRHQSFWVSLLWMIWVASACLCYIVYMQELPLWTILVLPLPLFVLTFGFVYYHHRRVLKFERTVLETCNVLNDAESAANGIEYQLLKNNQTYQSFSLLSSWNVLFGSQSTYKLALQLDEGDHQRYSKEFVSVPLYPAMVAVALPDDEKSSDIYTPFIPSQDEKRNSALLA